MALLVFRKRVNSRQFALLPRQSKLSKLTTKVVVVVEQGGQVRLCRAATRAKTRHHQLEHETAGAQCCCHMDFPLAILIHLPFEYGAIWSAISNWLGSPQTSLTASIWNFWQTRQCHMRATGRSNFWNGFRTLWELLRLRPKKRKGGNP